MSPTAVHVLPPPVKPKFPAKLTSPYPLGIRMLGCEILMRRVSDFLTVSGTPGASLVILANLKRVNPAFLEAAGERGHQRTILRNGVLTIDTALFVVITNDLVYSGTVLETEPKR